MQAWTVSADIRQNLITGAARNIVHASRMNGAKLTLEAARAAASAIEEQTYIAVEAFSKVAEVTATGKYDSVFNKQMTIMYSGTTADLIIDFIMSIGKTAGLGGSGEVVPHDGWVGIDKSHTLLASLHNLTLVEKPTEATPADCVFQAWGPSRPVSVFEVAKGIPGVFGVNGGGYDYEKLFYISIPGVTRDISSVQQTPRSQSVGGFGRTGKRPTGLKASYRNPAGLINTVELLQQSKGAAAAAADAGLSALLRSELKGKASSTPAKRRFISDVPGVAATNGTEGVKVTHGGFDQPLTRTLDYDPAQEDAMV